MKDFLEGLPPWVWLIVFVGGVAIVGVIGRAFQMSPEQQSLEQCISQMNQSAGGQMSRSELERICLGR